MKPELKRNIKANQVRSGLIMSALVSACAAFFIGVPMKKIDISTPTFQNTFALVDDLDFENLNKFKWYAHSQRGKLYAKRNIQVGDNQKTLSMHTAILGHLNGKEIDHRNMITLDNQRHNLRHCTRAENQRNRPAQSNNTSGYKGVSWSKKDRKWVAHTRYNDRKIYLGSFTKAIKAAQAYDKAALQYHGDFAKLNFPERCEKPCQ